MNEPLVEEELPHRSRKDTRRWCKGRFGREHQTDIRLNQYSRQLRDRFGETKSRCGIPSWSWNGEWRCHHERYCTVCEKILVPALPESECPDAPL